MSNLSKGVCAASVDREADFLDAVQIIAGVMRALDSAHRLDKNGKSRRDCLRTLLVGLVGEARREPEEFWQGVHNVLKG